MKRAQKICLRILKSPDFHVILILLAAAIIVMLPLFSAHAYMLGHDSDYHIETIIGLEQGDLFNFFNLKIIPDFAGNFGYGAGIFYPQFPHYLAAVIFHFLKIFGLSPIAALKIVYFFVIFFSGFFMYKFLRHNFRRRTPAFLAAIIYMTAPYFISDILIRDALNEAFVFIFIPIALFGFQYLIEKNYRRFFILFTAGFIGLVNTHLIITMYFTILLAVAALFLIKDWFNWRAVKTIFASVVVVVLSSLFFLVPMLQHKNAAEYAVFSGGMYTSELTAARAMEVSDYLSGQYIDPNFETYAVLFSNVFVIALAIIAIFRFKDFKSSQNLKPLFVIGIVFVVGSIFISSKIFPWTFLPDFLSAIQFPWRMICFLTVGLTLLSSLVLYDFKVKPVSLISGFCVASCIAYVIFIQTSLISVTQNFDTSNFSETTKKYIDYYPVSLRDNVENFKSNRKYEIVITNGSAEISDFNSGATDLEFSVTNVKEKVTLEIPKIYYLGYEIIATFNDGETENISYSESENGLIDFTIDKDAKISVKYANTRAGQISSVVSGLTLIGFCGYAIISSRKKA